MDNTRRIKHLEKYHPNEIQETISNGDVIHVNEKGKDVIISRYDLDKQRNIYIQFYKDGRTKHILSYFNLKKSDKDSRLIFATLSQIKPPIEVEFLIDFDKNHDALNVIHLNLKYVGNNINLNKKNLLDSLNHFPVCLNRKGNTIKIDYFNTFLDIINKLVEIGFLVFDKYVIFQLDSQSTSYREIDDILKKYIQFISPKQPSPLS